MQHLPKHLAQNAYGAWSKASAILLTVFELIQNGSACCPEEGRQASLVAVTTKTSEGTLSVDSGLDYELQLPRRQIDQNQSVSVIHMREGSQKFACHDVSIASDLLRSASTPGGRSESDHISAVSTPGDTLLTAV